MTAIDCDPSSPTHGSVVGWTELPTAGNELHHFGWNACSSALCHPGHGEHAGHEGGAPLERRYLVVPGLRSSRTYILDTKPDPRSPQVVRTIEADELARKAGYSRPHTVHCGPGGIFMSALGGANGNDGPVASRCSTTTPSRSSARGRSTGATSSSRTTCGGTSTTTR
jgi:methanethiol oxidase